MRIIQIASGFSFEIWQIVTWGEAHPDELDPKFKVKIPAGLNGNQLAKKLSAAADKHEGIDKPAKVLSWKIEAGSVIVRCDLNDGTVGVMRCTRIVKN